MSRGPLASVTSTKSTVKGRRFGEQVMGATWMRRLHFPNNDGCAQIAHKMLFYSFSYWALSVCGMAPRKQGMQRYPLSRKANEVDNALKYFAYCSAFRKNA